MMCVKQWYGLPLRAREKVRGVCVCLLLLTVLVCFARSARMAQARVCHCYQCISMCPASASPLHPATEPTLLTDTHTHKYDEICVRALMGYDNIGATVHDRGWEGDRVI